MTGQTKMQLRSCITNLKKNKKIEFIFPDYYEVDENGIILHSIRRHDFETNKYTPLGLINFLFSHRSKPAALLFTAPGVLEQSNVVFKWRLFRREVKAWGGMLTCSVDHGGACLVVRFPIPHFSFRENPTMQALKKGVEYHQRDFVEFL